MRSRRTQEVRLQRELGCGHRTRVLTTTSLRLLTAGIMLTTRIVPADQDCLRANVKKTTNDWFCVVVVFFGGGGNSQTNCWFGFCGSGNQQMLAFGRLYFGRFLKSPRAPWGYFGIFVVRVLPKQTNNVGTLTWWYSKIAKYSSEICETVAFVAPRTAVHLARSELTLVPVTHVCQSRRSRDTGNRVSVGNLQGAGSPVATGTARSAPSGT